MVQEHPKIAVLIPCYNEGKTIAEVVANFRHALPEAIVYVYDNNSTDDTVQQARQAGAVVRRETRQGKGNVVRSMFRDIIADCYVLVDGDNTYPAELAADMCRPIIEEGVDMVVGDRLSTTYHSENKRPFHSFGNKLVCWMINRLFYSHINDIMTGYRAFSRRFVLNCPIMSNGFEVETEMTIHALDKQMNVREIPIPYRDRPAGSFSKLNTYSDGFLVMATILRLYRDYRPYRFFSCISLLLLVVAIVMFLPVLLEYFHTGLVPRFPTLIVSGLLALLSCNFYFCGLILEVIGQRHRQLFDVYIRREE